MKIYETFKGFFFVKYFCCKRLRIKKPIKIKVNTRSILHTIQSLHWFGHRTQDLLTSFLSCLDRRPQFVGNVQSSDLVSISPLIFDDTFKLKQEDKSCNYSAILTNVPQEANSIRDWSNSFQNIMCVLGGGGGIYRSVRCCVKT